jgi:hypothetical protein
MIKNQILTYFILLVLVILKGNEHYAQIKNFNYTQELIGIEDQWHKIELPNEIYGNVKSDFSDIRIIGVTEKNDTLEAPYLLRLKNEVPKRVEYIGSIINSSKNEKGHYITLTFSIPEIINQISLKIKQQNFDWRITIEGSQDQKEWFTLAENQRILSINTNETNFSYTKVHFNDAMYKFYRIYFNTQEIPIIDYVSLTKDEITEGNSRDYTVAHFSSIIDKSNKSSTLLIDMGIPLSINSVFLNIRDTVDYYRNFNLFYAVDSIKTKDGWELNYLPLTNGTLNSIDKSTINFYPTIAQYFKIEIDNKDNTPLLIDSVKASGYIYELIIRFTEKATYYLCYSNEKSTAPEYDIAYFENKIPDKLNLLTLGEINIYSNTPPQSTIDESSFFNSIWLWAIMLIIIVTMGWFSIKMMRKIE